MGDRRSVCVRDFSALYPLSYGAILRVAPVGLEPTISGLVGMYSNSAVGRLFKGDEEWSEACSQLSAPPDSFPQEGEMRIELTCTPNRQSPFVLKNAQRSGAETSCLAAHLNKVLM